MASMLRPLRVCNRQKRKRLRNRCFATATVPISTGLQSLDRSRLPWSVPLDRSRLPRSAIMAVQVQSTDVFLCYQRLRVSCALCNNFQAARPRQTTERRLAPLYVEHMPSQYYIAVQYVYSKQCCQSIKRF